MTNPNTSPTKDRRQEGGDPWDSLSDFSGERNINDKTGRPRSFTTFDIYPKKPGETSEEYGERLRYIHKKTAEYQAAAAEREKLLEEQKEKEAYRNSEQGQKEAEATEKFDRLSDKLDQAVAEERMSREHAKALKEQQLERSVREIAGYQQEYEEKKAIDETSEVLDPQKTEELAYKSIEVDEIIDEKTHEAIARKQTEVDEIIDEKTHEAIARKQTEIDEIIEEKETKLLSDKLLELDVLIDEKENTERIQRLGDMLNGAAAKLGEYYARNRRLFVGAKNKASFTEAKGEYSELLDQYLKLKAGETYKKGKREIAEKLEARIAELESEIKNNLSEFVENNPEGVTRAEIIAEKKRLTQEVEQTLRQEYGEMIDALHTKVNADFLKEFLAQETNLETITIDKLDNGTLCRKFVNKVLNNRVLKGALIAAAAAGLVVTGVGVAAGIAAGTATIGMSFTAGGVAAGLAKGGILGGIMSRQNSKNSAIRNFVNPEQIKNNLKDIDVLNQSADVNNATSWLLEQYNKANVADRSSNRKRTAIAAGIGAAFGAIASGVQVGNITHETVSGEDKIIGYEPVETHPDVNIDNVYHQAGTGLENYCVNEAHLVSSPEEFYKPGGLYDIIIQSGQNNGLIEGQSGWTFEGTVDQWSPAAESTIREALNEAARQGVIPTIQTGGEPIYGPTTKIVEAIIPDAFYNNLIKATAGIAAAAAGGVTGGLKRSKSATAYTPGPVTTPGVAPVPEQQPVPIPESPTPASEPVLTPETAPVSEPVSTSESTPAPETNTPDTNESDTSGRTESASQEFRSLVESELGNIVDSEGIEIITSNKFVDDIHDTDRVKDWWQNLTPEIKDRILQFENEHGQNTSEGALLRMWLQTNQNELGIAGRI